MPFLPRAHVWTMVYRYIGHGTAPGCLQDVLVNGVRPNADGVIWITPHFFRHAEEARAFLTLPTYNKAECGLYVDVEVAFGFLDWKPSSGLGFRRPGGALEMGFERDTPIPADHIVEYFETQVGLTGPTSGSSPNVWEFRFVIP